MIIFISSNNIELLLTTKIMYVNLKEIKYHFFNLFICYFYEVNLLSVNIEKKMNKQHKLYLIYDIFYFYISLAVVIICIVIRVIEWIKIEQTNKQKKNKMYIIII